MLLFINHDCKLSLSNVINLPLLSNWFLILNVPVTSISLPLPPAIPALD